MGVRERVGRAAAGRVLVALVVVLVCAGVGAGAASAASPSPGGPTAVGTVPPEVQAAYDGEFLRQLVRATHGDVGQVRAGTVHQLFTFTRDFAEGGSTADPVEPWQEWVAGVEVDGEPFGWQRVYLDEGGALGSAGWNPDPEGARAFLSTTAGALVQVPSDNAFFTLVDGVVTPVKVQSWDSGLAPRSLPQVQADLAASRAEAEAAYADCSPADGCAGGGPGASAGGASDASELPPLAVLAFAGAGVLAAGIAWTSVRRS